MVMERLGAARRHPENQDPVRQKAIKTARQILKDFGVVDPGPKVVEKRSSTKIEKPINPLQGIVAEYKTQPHTPEFITSVFQTVWRVRGELAGIDLSVSECPYTQEELTQLEEEGRRVGYLPDSLATQKQRHLLDTMFTGMRSHSIGKGIPVSNEIDRAGWFDYETRIDAPYRGTNEEQLRELLASQDRLGMNLNEYVVAAQDTKLFTGEYLDQNTTWSRLLGSSSQGRVVSAYFILDGLLVVDWTHPEFRDQYLGGRSVGVKRT